MKKIIIYTDGGSHGNPGPAAIGVVFCNEKKEILKKYSEYLGGATNNEAEYQAIVFALKKFKALFGKKLAQNSEVEIRSDSELLINQLNGKYKILEPKIQSLFITLWNLKTDFKKLVFKFVSRQNNKEADRLVNDVLEVQDKTQKMF